ncbi:SBBP repeat-containing protein [Hymenobacter cellulosilyticus]|uniref:SBBP repeat-containing protein n=1 Tax=Hymenobacter cellulosilyticus TaxID=2932248 RepID=A0A8T9PY13_9BACT|nr:SBBP repeat-containing protein [Hymenobacter cellulosilyticus]UOQ70164.1 SBBP repeat-containing protein [Hymenobacter cellulosilyticus]
MRISTLCAVRYAVVVLLSFLTGLSAVAQTAPVWQSVISLGGQHSISGFTIDGAGNYYLTGYFSRPVTIAGRQLTTAGGFDGYVAKLSPSGTLLWLHQLGSTDHDHVHSVAVDKVGNVYVTGSATGTLALGNNLTFTGPAGTEGTMFLIRYSPQGIAEWVQQSNTIAFSTGTSMGFDAAGNLYLTGLYERALTIGSTTITSSNSLRTTRTGYLSRFAAATGSLQSLKTVFHSDATRAVFNGPKLIVLPTGSTYILTSILSNATFGSSTTVTHPNPDSKLNGIAAKYDAQGTLEWVQHFKGGDNRIDAGVADAAGNLFVVGDFYGTTAFGSSILTTSGYINSYDTYLTKISSQGVMQWIQRSVGDGDEHWNDVKLDASGSPYVSGSFQLTTAFGSLSLTAFGSGFHDIVVAAYTPQGQIKWVKQAGSTGFAFDYAQFLAFTSQYDLSVLGNVGGNSTFGPLSLSAGTTENTFLAHLNTSVLATQTPRPSALSMYPNPATDWVQLSACL